MSNAFWKGMAEGFIKNLPTILTGGSVLISTGTVIYSTWAGWKIKEITEDESIDTKTKVKKIALVSAPIAIGTVTAGGCAIAAQKENSKRLAMLAAGTAGAITLVNDETKEKALEMIDKNHKIHKAKNSDAKPNVNVGSNETIEVFDQVTGYKFKTTLSDLWFTEKRFNQDLTRMIGTGETMSMSEFYQRLLGDEYENIPAHEQIKFGGEFNYDGQWDKTVILSIQLDSELDENLKPYYTIDYDFID